VLESSYFYVEKLTVSKAIEILEAAQQRGLSGHAPYHYESPKLLNNVMRDYQPICRIRSWMSPL